MRPAGLMMMMLAGVAAAALAGASHAALVEETYTFPLPPMRGGQVLFTVRQ